MRKPTVQMDDPHDLGNVVEVELPWQWEICSACRGHGTSSAYLGAFTASEWHEQDEEFREDYIAGRYDRACEHCEGGKVKVPDRDRMTPEQIKAWDEQLDFEAECEAERRHERMMLGDY